MEVLAFVHGWMDGGMGCEVKVQSAVAQRPMSTRSENALRVNAFTRQKRASRARVTAAHRVHHVTLHLVRFRRRSTVAANTQAPPRLPFFMLYVQGGLKSPSRTKWIHMHIREVIPKYEAAIPAARP